ncbi:MAG: sigma 54-interacting transcriptional regulator, partial [Candidatus Korobacteraceae bacterium]
GQFSRLGGRVTVKVDVRVLAATNINMPQAIAQKTFREDLYYRLNSFVLRMPSLRERREEIPMILRHFMLQLADRYACAPLNVTQRLVEACENYPWPGNIRELENFVKRYLVLGDESAAIGELQKAMSQNPQNGSAGSQEQKQPQQQPDLKEMVRNLKNGAESEVISQVLEETAWNRKRAATKLNISYKALLYKIRQYDIRPRQAG